MIRTLAAAGGLSLALLVPMGLAGGAAAQTWGQPIYVTPWGRVVGGTPLSEVETRSYVTTGRWADGYSDQAYVYVPAPVYGAGYGAHGRAYRHDERGYRHDDRRYGHGRYGYDRGHGYRYGYGHDRYELGPVPRPARPAVRPRLRLRRRLFLRPLRPPERASPTRVKGMPATVFRPLGAFRTLFFPVT